MVKLPILLELIYQLKKFPINPPIEFLFDIDRMILRAYLEKQTDEKYQDIFKIKNTIFLFYLFKLYKPAVIS